jgi:hypothetical protein
MAAAPKRRRFASPPSAPPRCAALAIAATGSWLRGLCSTSFSRWHVGRRRLSFHRLASLYDCRPRREARPSSAHRTFVPRGGKPNLCSEGYRNCDLESSPKFSDGFFLRSGLLVVANSVRATRVIEHAPASRREWPNDSSPLERPESLFAMKREL